MKRLEGRVAIVTGAGRGLGRAHALFLAEHGASVVVNDLGGDVHGVGAELTPAQDVAREITDRGGRAVVSGHDVADWEQAAEMVRLAVDAFGDLHVLVNNAGILRDRTLANMIEAEWDAVVRVHLKGHAAPTRHALAYWRDRARAGHRVQASVVHTTSGSGLWGAFGQANYAAAKLAVIALSRTITLEAERYGVRSNAISPAARTRFAQATPGYEDALAPPADPAEFDRWDPANVSPVVGWLAEADCPATAQVFHVGGSRLRIVSMPQVLHDLTTDGRWTLEALDRELTPRLVSPLEPTFFAAQGG